ncbi:hypothetical protein PInf_007507 [Phytophthora infestans]|nr:hypothetical protein PInf_007507 [Phytophthora infestans]
MDAMQEQLTAMVEMVSAMQKRQNEELAVMRFYDSGNSDTIAAMRTEACMKPTSTTLVLNMEVQILMSKHRVGALLDTGCTRSAMDRTEAELLTSDVVLRPDVAKFRNADGSVGTTTYCAPATFKLLDFLQSRVCSHEFRVREKLLYLGSDFKRQQRMVQTLTGEV